MPQRILLLKQIPQGPDLGRLALRLMVFLPLFLKHGTEKLFTFGTMAQHFPDPFHLGPATTLAVALVSDGICAPLIILGLATRWAALYSFCNLFVAWGFVHNFQLLSRSGGNAGETLFLYLTACLTVFILGPGKYSIDGMIAAAQAKKAYKPAGMAKA